MTHPLQALEEAARRYDQACRQSARADNRARSAARGYENRADADAASCRALKILRSTELAEAAVLYTRWKDAQP